jgi:flavodoxin
LPEDEYLKSMKTLIIYESTHRGNTEKVAKKIAEVLGAELKKSSEVEAKNLVGYDLIGFGSGIYGGVFHKALIAFIKSLPDVAVVKAFVFSTHASKEKGRNKEAVELLSHKGFSVIGDFECQGVLAWGPFKFSKGHPSEEDLAAAAKFATELIGHSREGGNPDSM